MLEGSRLYDLEIRFRDTSQAYVAKDVCFMGTEGELFRLTNVKGETQWWPLCQVFNIRQLARRPIPPVDGSIAELLRRR